MDIERGENIANLEEKWRRRELNPRPSACKAGTLPLSYIPGVKKSFWRREALILLPPAC